MKVLKEIFKLSEWDNIKKKAKGEFRVLVFKYSPACSISHSVERSFEKWFNKISESTNLYVIKVNVISSRNLSREIAGDLNIEHESPQAIWISDTGEVKWDASHFDISEEELDKQLNK